MLPFQLFYPPNVLAPYASLQALSVCPTVLASYLLVQFSAVEIQQVESAELNKQLSELVYKMAFTHKA
jgi:hypothetical protein